MPVPLLAEGLLGQGFTRIPYIWPVLKSIPWVVAVVLLKFYFGGARCRVERVMHGKVVMVTVCFSSSSAACWCVLTLP